MPSTNSSASALLAFLIRNTLKHTFAASTREGRLLVDRNQHSLRIHTYVPELRSLNVHFISISSLLCLDPAMSACRNRTHAAAAAPRMASTKDRPPLATDLITVCVTLPRRKVQGNFTSQISNFKSMFQIWTCSFHFHSPAGLFQPLALILL